MIDEKSPKKDKPLIITPDQAPAYLKGPQPIDYKSLLSNATADQVKALTYENLALWAQFSGTKVDNYDFNFDEYRHLVPLYLDESKDLTLIKSAQMGATIYLLLRILWFARHYSVKVGLYFPTKDGVESLSKDRLKPIIDSCPDIKYNISDDVDTLNLKKIKNVNGNESSIYMSYLGGNASKDSVPLDMVAFDEVRLVELSDVKQACVRTSASPHDYKLYVSTAGKPGQTIDKLYKNGDQRVWTMVCGCRTGFVPSECFPDCIVEHKGEVYLRCPKCKYRINDPQNGFYDVRNPGADATSYSISKFVSKRYSVKKIWKDYKDAMSGIGSLQEFYNATLGRPFIDVDSQPVTMDVLENCVNTDIKWAYDPLNRKKYKNCAMGVDQRGGQNHVVIMTRNADNKAQIIHLEEIDDKNPRYWENGKPISPFKRLYELMKEFDVGLCVCDALPNKNEADMFARAFPGRVFLSWYVDSAGPDMVKWTDRIKYKESVKKGSKDIKNKYQVQLRRYDVLDNALMQFVHRNVEMPHPKELIQSYRNPDTAIFEPQPICYNLFFTHLCSMVREEEPVNPDVKDGRTRSRYTYISRDPHTVHAFTYAWVALSRLKKQGIFVI